MKLPMMLLWKGTTAPVDPILKRQGAMLTPCPHSPASQGTEQNRACVSRYDQSARNRTVSRKFSIGRLCICAGGLDTKNWQKLNCFIVFRVSILGAWSFAWGAKPPKAPHGDGTGPKCQSMTKIEMVHILQAQVCGCISAHPGSPHRKTIPETSGA